MPSVRDLLKKLDLGNSVAEFDLQLEDYFVETEAFRLLIANQIDIVAGDKGTGKTAVYRILQKRFGNYEHLRNADIIPAFNISGSPIFEALGEKGPLEEGQYIKFWKSYLLSLCGNWLLGVYDGEFTDSMKQLDLLLRGLKTRDDTHQPRNIFMRAISRLEKLFHWDSAEAEFSMSPDGSYTFKPTVRFGDQCADDDPDKSISVVSSLRILNQYLAEADLILWIAVDRLDEAFQGFPDVEMPALRGLLRTYLDLLEFENIKLKLFVRRDLFRHITVGGFVNLTHINARKFELVWDEEDLLNLLCSRIRQNEDFCDECTFKDKTDQHIFDRLFPEQVDIGKRKPKTWTWVMRRIRDGNDVKPPRNLIDLITLAQRAQIRTEDRLQRAFDSSKPVFESEALRKALSELSRQRVNDTLLAEARVLSPIVEKFRDGKAEHNELSLSHTLGVPLDDVRTSLKPLLEIGFFEDVRGTYKIPALYREGLGITQGKAFASTDVTEDDEE